MTAAERDLLFQAWTNRKMNYGAVSWLARKFGVSNAAVSNIILQRTGKRPSAHTCPKSKA